MYYITPFKLVVRIQLSYVGMNFNSILILGKKIIKNIYWRTVEHCLINLESTPFSNWDEVIFGRKYMSVQCLNEHGCKGVTALWDNQKLYKSCMIETWLLLIIGLMIGSHVIFFVRLAGKAGRSVIYTTCYEDINTVKNNNN